MMCSGALPPPSWRHWLPWCQQLRQRITSHSLHAVREQSASSANFPSRCNRMQQRRQRPRPPCSCMMPSALRLATRLGCLSGSTQQGWREAAPTGQRAPRGELFVSHAGLAAQVAVANAAFASSARRAALPHHSHVLPFLFPPTTKIHPSHQPLKSVRPTLEVVWKFSPLSPYKESV